jgi:predicted CoA-binding protein
MLVGLSRWLGMETDQFIHRALEICSTIAVYGMSRNPKKPAHYVPLFLQSKGYTIIPITPHAAQIIGQRCYPHLRDVQEDIDILQVFRPSERVPAVMREAVARREERQDISVVWLQEGIQHTEAQRIAEEAGIVCIQDRCMQKEFKRLFPERG